MILGGNDRKVVSGFTRFSTAITVIMGCHAYSAAVDSIARRLGTVMRPSTRY